jgi:hypothetical protein
VPCVDMHQVNWDAVTLRQIAAWRMTLTAECLKCRRICAIELEEMTKRFGAAANLGQIRSRFRCGTCRSRKPIILTRQKGVYGDRAWYPHAPLGRN